MLTAADDLTPAPMFPDNPGTARIGLVGYPLIPHGTPDPYAPKVSPGPGR